MRRQLILGVGLMMWLTCFAASPAKRVLIQTSMGNITVELNQQKAPVTVKNFLKYVNQKFYNGTIFHRVMPGFMIQGGGFTKKMVEKTGYAPIQNEAANGLNNDRGTIAMARTSNPNSATSQFFINLTDNQFLNYTSPTAQGYGYTVFGKVISGMKVVDKIAAVKTGSLGMYNNVPVLPIIIKHIKVIN